MKASCVTLYQEAERSTRGGYGSVMEAEESALVARTLAKVKVKTGAPPKTRGKPCFPLYRSGDKPTQGGASVNPLSHT